jgi:Ni/Fe-hydrogenase subunit HybB-like protein
MNGATEKYERVNKQIGEIVLAPPLLRRGWLLGFGISFVLLMVLNVSVAWLFLKGVGIWGINIPVAWGFAIINFVWWIGIGHAGTFISAILLLLHQEWRTSINRFAEAMTLFAVACAGIFPLLHLGRPQVFYWLLPYPDTMGLWPQWRSPLVWDVFAVSTYLTVSLVFWYMGLIPDFATMRDRAGRLGVRRAFGILALGWRNSIKHWKRYETAYLLLAGLATPLVVSVHSVVSFDFAASLVSGWHSTIFPPYFVAGAIFSGFAMVLTLIIPVRRIYGLKNLITDRHLDNCAKVMLVSGLLVAFGYLSEIFTAWYSDERFEAYITVNRMLGSYAWAYWMMMACNVAVPQALWFRGVRQNAAMLFAVSLLINLGMWLERFVIIVTSLHRDYLPSSWEMYYPTFWDWSTLVGSLGLFLTLLFVFVRLVPMISIAEVRREAAEENP